MGKRKSPRPNIVLPEEQLDQKVEKKVDQRIRAFLYKGPMPLPEQIKKYEEIYPGAADSFLKK